MRTAGTRSQLHNRCRSNATAAVHGVVAPVCAPRCRQRRAQRRPRHSGWHYHTLRTQIRAVVAVSACGSSRLDPELEQGRPAAAITAAQHPLQKRAPWQKAASKHRPPAVLRSLSCAREPATTDGGQRTGPQPPGHPLPAGARPAACENPCRWQPSAAGPAVCWRQMALGQEPDLAAAPHARGSAAGVLTRPMTTHAAARRSHRAAGCCACCSR